MSVDKVISTIYADTPERIYTNEFLFMYGPHMAMHDNEYHNMILKCNRNPLMQYFAYGAKLLGYIQGQCRILDLKANILDLNKDVSASYLSRNLRVNFHNLASEIIENIRGYQKEHLCTESAMINMAPIINYESMSNKSPIKEKYFPDNKPELVKCNPADFYIQLARGCKSDHNGDYTPILLDLLQDSLLSVLIDHHVVSDAEDPLYANNHLLEPSEEYGKAYFAFTYAYYFFAGCKFQHIDIDEVIRFLEKMCSASMALNKDFMGTVESFIDSINIETLDLANEATLLQEKVDEQVQDILDSSIDHEKHVNDDESFEDSIYKILNYCHTHREIQCTNFNNTLFLSQGGPSLTNYSIYRGVYLIAKMSDGRLILPYMDLVDNHKNKYLTIENDEVKVLDDL